MAVPKSNRTSSVQVPVNNIQTYVRVPGYPPYPLSRALQEWDGVEAASYVHTEPGENNPRVVHEIRFDTESGKVAVVVSEQIFEVALYTRATKRFSEWMQANRTLLKSGGQ